MAASSGRIYVGLEISTQQVKLIAVNDVLDIVCEENVKFDTDLSEFKTTGGVHPHEDGVTVTAPPLMWIKAIDLLLERLRDSGFAFSKVAAISGAGQQHGSVYWKYKSKEILSSLDPSKSFYDQLEGCFSINDSPIWMDSSTDQECQQVEKNIGGPLRLSEITGCRAYHRITGNQITKIFKQKRAAYDNTERISLVSSFGASLFIGNYAPIDESDGSGMNLLDLHSRRWSQECIKAFDILDLESKLGPAVPSATCVGSISSYLVDRYGFTPDCKVISFTGDNPASLAGVRCRDGDVVISLGTSDTVLLWLHEPKASLEGLSLINPLETKDYMGMLCFKNGSLARERVRNESAGGSWVEFERLLESSLPGNNGNIGIYFYVPEITPNAVGVFRFDSKDNVVSSFPNAIEVRAIVESQLVAKRVHSENLGYKLGQTGRILATGGASSNKALLQVLADVFNIPVYVQTVANSACLGSAYRAKHGYLGGTISFEEVVENAPVDLECQATPDPSAVLVYNALCLRYRQLEQQITTTTSL